MGIENPNLTKILTNNVTVFHLTFTRSSAFSTMTTLAYEDLHIAKDNTHNYYN